MNAVPREIRRYTAPLPAVAAALGLAVALAVVARQDLSAVMVLLRRAGPALLWIVPYRLLPLALDALSWRLLLAPYDAARRAGTGFLLWVACVREAVARLLPLASVGGELVGIRLPLLRGVASAPVMASVALQVLVSVVNQYLFASLGLVLMLHLGCSVDLGRAVGTALLAGLPLPVLVAWLLRHGRVFERLQGVLRRLLGNGLPPLDGVAVDAILRAALRQPRRLLAALALEFAGLLAGSVEIVLALALLGHSVSLAAALALEASVQALRHVFFVVPGALGVQEAALLLLGGVLGLPADLCIALSLVKRMREVLFGLPFLASWQWAELRWLRQR